MKPKGIVNLDQFKEQLAQGKAPEDVVLRKSIIPEEVREVEGESRTLSFVISTDSVDRDKDTIAVEGWDLKAFRKVPTVLWAHDYSSLPIAKATSVKQEENKLTAKATFAEHPFAETVFQMLKGGFLKATSVGFRPKVFAFNEERGGIDFKEQELLEFSIVPVPANAEALIDAQAKGIDTGPLKEWALNVIGKPHIIARLKLPRHITEGVIELALEDEKPLEDVPPLMEGSAIGSPAPIISFADQDITDLAERLVDAMEEEYEYDPLIWKRILEEHKQDGFEMQTVIFPKRHWDSAAAAREWLKDHDLKSDKLDENDTSFRFRQRDPGDFERIRLICLTPKDTKPGDEKCRIQAAGGPLKAVDPQEELTLDIIEQEEISTFEVEGFLPPMEVDADEITVIVENILKEAVADSVTDAVRSALMRVTGRVD